MRIYIDELSFIGQAPDIESAASILRGVIEVAQSTTFIRGNNPIKRHRVLKFRELIKDRSIHDIIFLDLMGNFKYRDLAILAIELLMKGPFIDSELAEIPQDHKIVDEVGTCCEGSCYQAAIFSPSGGAVISALKPCGTSRRFIRVTCSARGNMLIRNYDNLSTLTSDRWYYEANPKHEILKDKYICGEFVTKMDLNHVDAQNILSRGFKHMEGRVFSANGEKWYLFREHTKNHYHAFPAIVNKDHVPIEVVKAWKSIDNRNEGQVFLYFDEAQDSI